MDVQSAIKKILQDINSIERRLNTLGGGAGQANTASNIGVGGVGLYQQKVGVDLQFRNINAGSAIVTVVLDAGNNEVDINVDPSQIDLDDLGDVNAAGPANNDVLAWDTAASEWQDKSLGALGGGAVNPFAFRRSGRCYTTWSYYSSTTISLTRDRCYAMPFIVPVSQSFDALLIYVSTAQTNGVARVGIYTDDGDVYPEDLVVESGVIDCTAIGYKSEAIAETLDPGLYWLVINSDGDANIGVRALDYNITTPLGHFAVLGQPNNNFSSPCYTHYYVNQAYGNLPDPFPGGATLVDNQNLPMIMCQVA